MAIAFVASVTRAGGSTGGTTAAIDTTGATLLVVSVGWYGGGGGTTLTVTDSKGNAYTALTARVSGNTRQQVFYRLAPTVGTGHTFTVNAGALGIFPGIVCQAFSGVGSYQTESGATTTGGGPLASGSVTPPTDGALVFTGRAGNGTATTDALSPVGFALTTVAGSAGTNVQESVGYYVQPTAAAINPTWSWTPSTPTETAVATAVFLPPTVAASVRVSQLIAETLTHPTPAARAGQLVVETLSSSSLLAPVHARVTQVLVETLSPVTPDPVVSQVVVETLTDVPPPPLRVSQAPVELLDQWATAARVSQAPVETVQQVAAAQVFARVSQAALEIVYPFGCYATPEPPEPPDPGAPTTDVEPDCVDATTRLVNLALAHLGVTDTVLSLSTDASRNAETARLHYTTEIDAVLRAHPWKFATRYATLVRLAGSLEAPVSGDWTYQYRVPADCLFVRRIVPSDGRQRRFDPAPVPFDTTEDATSGLLTANAEAVEIEYTARIACPARVRDPLFRRAVTWRLAHAFAAPLGRDTRQAIETYGLYREQILEAQMRDQGEQQPQAPPHVGEAEWIRGRQGEERS